MKRRRIHAPSILQDEKVCYLTGREDNTREEFMAIFGRNYL